MHVRTTRTAVAVTVGSTEEVAYTSTSQRQSHRPPSTTLWASRALDVRQGRLIGVRVSATRVDVALVGHGNDGMRWIGAEGVLTESQARLWLRTSKFTLR